MARPSSFRAYDLPETERRIRCDYSIAAPPFDGNAPNVRGLTFATNENSYLIGCLAGLMVERQGGKQVISAVGGIKLPTVVDRDQSDLGPHILTSAVKRVDTSVFDTVKAAQDGTFKGGEDAVFDLENEGVAVGKISPRVPQELIDRMNEIGDQLKAGELKAPSTL